MRQGQGINEGQERRDVFKRRHRQLPLATDAESTHRLRIGMRLPFHQAVLHVAPKFLADEITALSPELAADRRSDQVHFKKFYTHPWRRLAQSLAPSMQ